MKPELEKPNNNQSFTSKSKLLDKYFKNICTSEEVDTLFSWLLENSNKEEKEHILRNQWEKAVSSANPGDQSEMQQRLDSIHHKINLAETENRPTKKNDGKIIHFNWKQILYRAAVIILLPALTLFVYINYFQDSQPFLAQNQKPVMNEIISPVGSRISLELSDGTKVWLNHGSKLLYPQKFTEKKRTVTLIGEGYFDVAHNPQKPFIVETNEINVTALGTKFNVKAYPNDKTVSATLKSGKIEVQSPKGKIALKPNQHLELGYNSNKFEVINVDPEKYISWKDGRLVFKDDDFQSIADRLSRWYNVDIKIIDPEVKKLTYTATFIDEPLYQILEMLAAVTPIKYQISERNKLPDGTYSRRIIRVYSKN